MKAFLFLKINSFLRYLLNLKIKQRKIYFICVDLLLLTFSFLLSLWLLNLNNNINYNYIFFFLFFTSLYLLFGNYYKHLTRYSSSIGFYKIALKNTLLIISIKVIFYLFGIYYPLKFWLLLCLLSSSFTIAIRVFLRDLINVFNIAPKNDIRKVAIYGTGPNEVQFSKQILISGSHNIVTFIDKNSDLWNRYINGIKVRSLEQISNLDVDQLLVTTSSINTNEWLNILRQLKIIKPGIRIFKIPAIDSIEDGKKKIDSLKPISLEDLLFRESIPPKEKLFGPSIENKVVLVTGAAGSIGKELSLQILALNPSKLVLLDFSEPNLFELKNIVIKNNLKNISVFCELGNTSDYNFMHNIFKKHKPDILFHASAYKHVTLLENNEIEGVKNNIRSTLNVCNLAFEFSTKKLILISSDKAVRPTSLMGVTKRVSELIFSSYAHKSKNSIHKDKLIFSMVRFGNVLGSSGSVVPIFQEQIENGGPITVTDPEVTRYFMTIPEAASLVIQSSVLAKGVGEVFLLDMGKPMKIKSLAEQMIILNGLTIKNDFNPSGDIEIIYRGLGAGEKIFEELLIAGESQNTEHPLIFKAIEKYLEYDFLKEKLDILDLCLENNDIKKVIKILQEIVPEWSRN